MACVLLDWGVLIRVLEGRYMLSIQNLLSLFPKVVWIIDSCFLRIVGGTSVEFAV